MKIFFISAVSCMNLNSNLKIGAAYEILNTKSEKSGFYGVTRDDVIFDSPTYVKNGSILTLVAAEHVLRSDFKALIEFRFLYDEKIICSRWCENDQHFTFMEIKE